MNEKEIKKYVDEKVKDALWKVKWGAFFNFLIVLFLYTGFIIWLTQGVYSQMSENSKGIIVIIVFVTLIILGAEYCDSGMGVWDRDITALLSDNIPLA